MRSEDEGPHWVETAERESRGGPEKPVGRDVGEITRCDHKIGENIMRKWNMEVNDDLDLWCSSELSYWSCWNVLQMSERILQELICFATFIDV